MNDSPGPTQKPNAIAGLLEAVLGQTLVFGFTCSLAMWVAWFITHLPWFAIPEQARLAVVLTVWVLAAAMMAASPGIAIAGGLLSSLLGLLILGSKLVQAASATEPGNIKPAAPMIILGFLILGASVGLVGSVLGKVIPRGREPDWLARFALVTAITVAPLLFIGGLVTSTNSGMAVPDWPNTYGANMFLYPLGSAGSSIFLEHSHRLFGTLVGLASLTLMIWTIAREQRTWVKTLAAVAFALVVIQGVLGGYRVLENKRVLAMLHGVMAQLTFGTIVALAVALCPSFKLPRLDEHLASPRKLRVFVTSFLHLTILQLIFGAVYRHFRDNHSLYSHAGLAAIVLIFALAAGFAARALHGDFAGIGKTIRRTGLAILIVVGLQFVLGWVTFMMGGKSIAADSPAQAMIRTVHQANGALVLALAVIAYFWTKRLIRITTPQSRVE